MMRIGAFVLVCFVVACGRLVATANGWHASVLPVLLGYGLLAGGIAAFAVDLVRARSLLQRKILCIRILLIALLCVILLDSLIAVTALFAVVLSALCAVLVAILTVVDLLGSARGEYLIAAANALPRRYLRRRPLKSAAETLLRLFPFPEPVGLYRIGSADADSPVLVTGNFELTIRRVCTALKRMNCWLLVCDSRGVNIWCASMAGHFSTDSVVQAITTTRLVQRVRTRRLLVPQLCAASLSLEQLRTRTGFSASFGPMYIGELERFLSDPADPAVRRARFPLNRRLEMALGCPLILTLLLVLFYNFIGLSHLRILLPLLYLFSLFHGLIFPRRPVKRVVPWALLCGAVFFLFTAALSRALFPGLELLYSATAGIGSAYLATEFSGWSPLLKYSLIPGRTAVVKVDKLACTGCRRCVEVCPQAVFGMLNGAALVLHEERCVTCGSCFVQCPTGVVRHSHAG